MKVLIISTDRKIFKEGSGVRQRMIEYGGLVKELHIIVFSKKSSGILRQQISENTWIYSTNSINRWLYIFNAIKIGKKIVSDNSDWLVTTQDPFETGIVGWCIAKSKKRKIKLQLQIHTDFLSLYFVKGSVLNKVRVRIAKFLLPKANCVRVVSNRIKKSILSANIKLKSDPFVLPIFIDIEAVKNVRVDFDLHVKYPQFDKIILMVSRLEKEKNIPLALSVFKQVLEKYPKTGLVIVGDGSRKMSLKEHARNYSLKDNVVFEDGKSNVHYFYKTADMFLHTSNYEGYGMVFVEASVLGCPIVTTDVGIVSEFFEDGKSAFICKVGDKNCLVEKIIELTENKTLKDSFVEKAKNEVHKHIKEKTKKRYLADYKKIWEKCGE